MTQENQQGSRIEEPGGYGTPTPEEEMPGAAGNKPDAAVPSADAEMDASNTEKPDAEGPVSSESGQDAAGLPDGSGTDLPGSKAPKDRDSDDKESFDAG